MPKYFYKDQDITIDMLIKIEHIVRLLAAQNRIPFDDQLELFYSSRTYKALINTKSCLWAESAEYIADEYEREQSQ